MRSPYAGQGSIIVPPHKVIASTPWGKRNPNISRSRSSAVTITDREGNVRVVAPATLTKSGVVRLPKGRKARLAGGNVVTLDLNEQQEREILARLAGTYNKGFNIHDK